MGDWIHCNVCIRMPSQGNEQFPFYFTSCGHIICGKCYETGPQDQCVRCNKRANAVKINRNLRTDLQMFFRNPKELLEQYIKNLNAVLDFQSGHRQHLQRARQEQQKKAMKYVISAQLVMKQKTERERKILAEKDSLIREIEKLRHHAQKLEQMLATSSVARNNLQSPHSAGRTTRSSVASTERSGGCSSGRFATSTPISDCLETNGFKLAGGNRSLSRVAAAFSHSGIEPSPIALSSAAFTTPDILGLRKNTEKSDNNWLNGGVTNPNHIFS
uniref:RING-type domain-containing protein n=1 Tax=Setaria digitata TaxID=48799 RepID=A0A915Q1D3_9BILA